MIDPGYMDSMPNILYHAGIRIVNDADIVYEYTEGGIEAKTMGQEIIDKGYHLLENYSYTVSQEIVNNYIEWMTSPNVQAKYSRETYDKALNNCIHFLKDSCPILRMQFPDCLQEFLDWLGKHPKLVRFTGVRSGGSVSSSSSAAEAK
ncbi:uncharacterized protein LOC110849286 [Folsomia candida]|uniref:Uncharacterized protein n=1 Tax=Folsomia candida TaxID=158441 RepID=A0A226EF04_FOLCA|nr:uncharacterized protein LOC110849286 [Folsomia candida]OXA55657.1 hypothetical protein Fcan01_08700 [Folsomia candida]